MGISDRIKNLTGRARESAAEAAAEHKDQIHDAVEKAGRVADERTGGKYHEKIARAGEHVEGYVQKLAPGEGEPGEGPPAGEAAPAQGEGGGEGPGGPAAPAA